MVLSLAGCSSGGCTTTRPDPELSAQNTYDTRRQPAPPSKTSWGQFDPANPGYYPQGTAASTPRSPVPGYDPRLAARSYVAPAPTAPEPMPSPNFSLGASAASSPPSDSMPPPVPSSVTRSLPPPSFEVAYEEARPAPAAMEPTPKPAAPQYSPPRNMTAPQRITDPDILLAAAPPRDFRESGSSGPALAAPGGINTRSKPAAEPKSKIAATDETSQEPAMPDNPAAVRLVNNKRISLNYKFDNVGSSGVSSVELWYTRDGRHWKKQMGRGQAKPPFIVEVAEEGLYGFTLVARNGMGIGKPPPQAGDQPQVWVAVDWTKPNVRLLGIEPGADSKAGNIVIGWSASDKNLGPRPITLSYAEQAGGPWMPIVSNAENTGRYVWQVPDKTPGKLWFRVEACDLAGNVGWAESRDPLVLDLAPPNVSIVTVDSADP
jgi:hypothetical protein